MLKFFNYKNIKTKHKKNVIYKKFHKKKGFKKLAIKLCSHTEVLWHYAQNVFKLKHVDKNTHATGVFSFISNIW